MFEATSPQTSIEVCRVERERMVHRHGGHGCRVQLGSSIGKRRSLAVASRSHSPLAPRPKISQLALSGVLRVTVVLTSVRSVSRSSSWKRRSLTSSRSGISSNVSQATVSARA
ncbi:hypothetical protein GCM10020000_16350 [Streptomyces olivoverticillatus]